MYQVSPVLLHSCTPNPPEALDSTSPCEDQFSGWSVILSDNTACGAAALDASASGTGGGTTTCTRRPWLLGQFLPRTRVHPTAPSSRCLLSACYLVISCCRVCFVFSYVLCSTLPCSCLINIWSSQTAYSLLSSLACVSG